MFRFLLSLICLIPLVSSVSVAAPQGIKRAVFPFSWNGGSRLLKLEVLDDDLVHFELFERREKNHENHGPSADGPIWTSPLVDGEGGIYQEGYQGPSMYHQSSSAIETAELQVTVLPESRCFEVFDKKWGKALTRICGEDLDKDNKLLQIEKRSTRNIYGVGNLFINGQSADGDWMGKEWNGRKHGNFRFGPDSFYDGGPSVSQFPVMYAVGAGQNYALFLDHVYRMSWNFRGHDQMTARTWGDELRGFILSGPDLADLRRDFMQLTGKPPVPPKSLFGHWTSEFGYDNWAEIESDVASLRKNDFPLDGVALDLQWFGGTFDNPNVARMGTLQFNEREFPNPKDRIKWLYDQYGIQFMPIEESYIDNRLADHRALWDADYRSRTPGFSGITNDQGCFLARNNLNFDPAHGGWSPVNVTTNMSQAGGPGHNVWWGRGGMLDWTNPEARKFWHQLKRLSLSEMGIFSHWLDLGEPEMYYEYAFYRGFPELFREYEDSNGHKVKHAVQGHGDIHNVYNLLWAKGIKEGYDREENKTRLVSSLNRLHGEQYHYRPRHFTMSRAGTVGSQRFGGMWSGDVMGNFENLRGHLQTQMHMLMAGMDYYGSDAGGFFHQNRPPEDPFERDLYTQWFATSSLLDLPVRPHGWGLAEENGDQRFGADVRGHLDSNRANVRRRYELIPYTYSWAHRANRFGDPIYPPLVYHFQNDTNVRELGNIKMIGDSLLFAVVAGRNQKERKVYLPQGRWFDYENGKVYDSHGAETEDIGLYRRERVPASELAEDPHRAYFMVPLFARAGAIIPKMPVDEKTVNTLGRRSDGSRRDELIVKVFSDSKKSEFTLYEDDGVSTGYQHGEVRMTDISQKLSASEAEVTIEASKGGYVGAVDDRETIVEFVLPSGTAKGARVNGSACKPKSSFQVSDACWFEKAGNVATVWTKARNVRSEKTIVLERE